MTDGPHEFGGADHAAAREIADCAAILRLRIREPESFPQAFPQEYTLMALANLLDRVADAARSSDLRRWSKVVDASLEISTHVRHNRPGSAGKPARP